MIRVSVSAVGSPGDDDVRLEPRDLLCDAIDHAEVQRAITEVVAEFPVGEAEEDGRIGAERGCRAPGFVGADARQLFAFDRIGAFLSLPARRVDLVNLSSLARVSCEDR